MGRVLIVLKKIKARKDGLLNQIDELHIKLDVVHYQIGQKCLHLGKHHQSGTIDPNFPGKKTWVVMVAGKQWSRWAGKSGNVTQTTRKRRSSRRKGSNRKKNTRKRLLCP